MNLNMTHALELAHYAHDAATELLDDASIALDTQHPFDDPINLARAISADQLESAAFANSILDSLFDDFLPMILIYELICQYIMNLTNCTIDDICADY